MQKFTILLLLLLCFALPSQAQDLQDDFEGNGNINTWTGDDCGINTSLPNPFQQGNNPSATVLEYKDTGGLYANIKFDVAQNFDLSVNHSFSFKLYVPNTGLTGSQTNQVSLKLQDGNLATPWSTQTEIIKPILLDQWQTVSFDFQNDPFINLNGGSFPPYLRSDLNRVLIQINGENNTDQVLAYIDDFAFDADSMVPGPVFNTLVWSDEFDVDGAIDPAKWFPQTKLPAGGSWYNGEIQHYTNRLENASVNNGQLNLVAKKESFTDQGHTKQYTSARLNSKFAFTYGRVEIRAKLPSGVGTWPAIWMLGKNITEDGAWWEEQGFGTTGWPACGEIDIMEHWGNNQNFVQSATHTPSSSGNTFNKGGQTIPTASNDFHVYALEWTPDRLIFSVDSVPHYIYNPQIKNDSTWPFDEDQYLLLNIAIEPTIDPNFTQGAMEIDYVRVYQENTVSTIPGADSGNLLTFPNPTGDQLTIPLENPRGETASLSIFNAAGKSIRTEQVPVKGNQVKVKQLNGLSSGVYFITFELDGKNHYVKFLKE